MTTQLSVKDLSKAEWLRLRKEGIGGSDAGAVCGMNPYRSAMDVFCDKVSAEVEETDNEAMRQGRDLEDYVARRFMEATGLKVRRSNVMYRNREYPFMLADVDRLVVGERAGLECKTASAYSADKWKDGRIPAHYEIQCHHYMAVTGLDAWYLAVVILGRGFQYIKIERDEELIRNLVQIETDFWNDHVLAGVMPEPDGSRACEEILGQYYPAANRETLQLPPLFNERLERRESLLEMIERFQAEQRQIEQEIKLYMKDGQEAVNDRYRVTWSDVESARLDVRRLKEEKPEVYQEFAKKTSSRRFTVRAA